MSSGDGPRKVFTNEWMTVRDKIGPEIGIGHCLHQISQDTPILILKSCIGNRSLGWDLLPPGSPPYEFDGRIYAGYHQSPDSWPKGTTPQPINWYAGVQYDGDTNNCKAVLDDLETY
jgi:hypothetical protein